MTNFDKVYYRSTAIGRLSSQKLIDLKNTLKEIESGRAELESAITHNRNDLKSITSKLSRINWFPIRLFFKVKIHEYNFTIQSLNNSIDDLQEKLARHQLGLEIAIPEYIDEIFNNLCDDFSKLSSVDKIWDKTTSKRIDKQRKRTRATNSIERMLVKFGRKQNPKILSEYQSLHLQNVNGHDIEIYPQFVFLEAQSDFALVDLSELIIDFWIVSFIEDEGVPRDSTIIGKTWLKCNKDGTRDKRFADNYEIPIVKYGELHFKSASGINEVYMFSNPEPALAFKSRFDEYKLALLSLESEIGNSGDTDNI